MRINKRKMVNDFHAPASAFETANGHGARQDGETRRIGRSRGGITIVIVPN
jgi:hypothetical protein